MKKLSVRILAFLLMMTILCCAPAYAGGNPGMGGGRENSRIVDRTCTIRKYHINGEIPVDITFRIKFDVRRKDDGTYTIEQYMIYPVMADDHDADLYYVYDGEPTIGYQDGFRVMRVTQAFTVCYDHLPIDSLEISAFAYFDRTTGRVSLKEM